MSRAYTAWVIQAGNDEAAQFFVKQEGVKETWAPQVSRALQLARRADARRLIEGLRLSGVPKAVEKTFG